MRKLFPALLLLSTFSLFAQTPAIKPKVAKPVPVMNDFAMLLHEETLNKVFDAIGEISGTSDYSVLLIKGKYHWTVVNSRINLKPDSSDFTCDAKVKVGPFEYQTPVKGIVKIWYDNDKNLINVKISSAIFELYTKVFGQRVHIKNIELADYFTEPFQFEGPKSMETDFSFMTPDSVLKKVYMKPCDCAMELRWKEIITRCEVAVSDKPFPIGDPTGVMPPEAKIPPADESKKPKQEIKK
jgi:hypothetical protein